MSKITVTLTLAQQNALIWAMTAWEQSMEGYECETDKQTATKIRAARVAMRNVYDKIDPIDSWVGEIAEGITN
jgi:hypothetical protein